MLKITIPEREMFDESTQTFITSKEQTLLMEHSLVSLSKWEAKWHKPFLSKKEKTVEETLDYFRCMTITQNVDPEVYRCLTLDNFNTINDYMKDSMTATTISDSALPKGKTSEVVTSEIIYYWMVTLNIPFECQKWHLNRLLTLIKVCNVKNMPPKKMSPNAIMSQNAALNAARRKRLKTRG